jgi:hypothetical protein
MFSVLGKPSPAFHLANPPMPASQMKYYSLYKEFLGPFRYIQDFLSFVIVPLILL